MTSIMDLALYLTTAVTLFAQVLWLVAWTLWGAPTSTAFVVVDDADKRALCAFHRVSDPLR